MKRVFIALPIDEKIGHNLQRMQFGIDGARFSPIENFHITLRFIGDLSEDLISDLDERIGEINFPKFAISLNGVNHFGNDAPHSIHALVAENKELNSLHGRIDKICYELGFPNDHKKYIPHVTIGYLNKQVSLQQVIEFERSNALFKSKSWKADRFYLYASRLGHGPSQYEILAQYPLLEN